MNHNLESLKWTPAPDNWGLNEGEITFVKQENGSTLHVVYEVETTPENKKRGVLLVGHSGKNTNWMDSRNPADWNTLDNMFGRKSWKDWLKNKV